MQVKQEALGSPNGECRNDDRATPSDSAADDFRKSFFRISRIMSSIAVSRFDDQIVRLRGSNRIDDSRVVVTTEIAGEHNPLAIPVKLDGSRAQDMACASKERRSAARKI